MRTDSNRMAWRRHNAGPSPCAGFGDMQSFLSGRHSSVSLSGSLWEPDEADEWHTVRDQESGKLMVLFAQCKARVRRRVIACCRLNLGAQSADRQREPQEPAEIRHADVFRGVCRERRHWAVAGDGFGWQSRHREAGARGFQGREGRRGARRRFAQRQRRGCDRFPDGRDHEPGPAHLGPPNADLPKGRGHVGGVVSCQSKAEQSRAALRAPLLPSRIDLAKRSGCRDSFGFSRDFRYLLNEAKHLRATRKTVEARNEAWREYIMRIGGLANLCNRPGQESAELKALVRRGIPMPYRPAIWARLSGANEARRKAPRGYYNLLVRSVDKLPPKVGLAFLPSPARGRLAAALTFVPLVARC
eukprot:scaffold395_cov243-Pinguiococcus_pyrenoidosus.AAC.11